MGDYILHIDGKPIQRLGDLDEAKEVAAAHLGGGHSLTIECPAAPAPTAIWRYDTEIGDWVRVP